MVSVFFGYAGFASSPVVPEHPEHPEHQFFRLRKADSDRRADGKQSEDNGPWASNFRMTLLALARSVTNRRADGGPPDSSLIKITYCQQSLQNDGRRLRGIQFLPCIQWTRHEHSCPSVSIRGSLTQPFFHFANKMREGNFGLVDFRMPFLLPFEGEIAIISICNHLL